jgi:NADPH:quinone reductase-like Zn-dependent oxidoreductase
MTRLPGTMRALRFRRHGGPQVLELAEIPVPRPAAGEVLVRVHAAGLNPVDAGLVAEPVPFVEGFALPAVPGWDVAGTVVMRGPDSDGLAVGDEVFGMSRFPRLTAGTFAEYTTVPVADLAPKPAGLTWAQAGALPLSGLTALQAFDAVGGITPGTRVLSEAAAGGVGHVAVQVAKAAGATVIGTASSRRHDFLRSLGADELIDYKATADVFAAATPVHGVLHSTTPQAMTNAARRVERDGFLVSISQDIDSETAAIADERGVRHADILVGADGAGMRRLATLVEESRLAVKVARTYPLERAGDAFKRILDRHTPGKLVLLP